MRSKTFPLFAIVVLVLLGYSTYQALVVAPMEQTMGDAQRIFYYHVPAAIAAYTLFTINFIASIIFLARRKEAADVWARVSAEVGLVFATVVLITGPIWARFAWGTWWTWEPRLTTFLILWLLYISYMILRRSSEAGAGSTLAAALAVFAYLDVPFSYVANRFRGHHPPPITLGDPRMKAALLINILAFAAFAALLLWFRYELERTSRKLAALHVQRASSRAMAALVPATFLLQTGQHLDPRNFMYAAYISAWVVYVGYLLLLIAKAARLKREAGEMGL
jgi:heme exporter protein C